MAKLKINTIGEIKPDGSYSNGTPIEITLDPTFIYWIEQSNSDGVTIAGGVDKNNVSFNLGLARLITGAQPPQNQQRNGDLGPTFMDLLGDNTFQIVVEKSLEPAYMLGSGNDDFLKNQSSKALEIAIESAKANGEGVFEELLWVYSQEEYDQYQKCSDDITVKADKIADEFMEGFKAREESGSTDPLFRLPTGGIFDTTGLPEEDVRKRVIQLVIQSLSPAEGCGTEPIKRRILNYLPGGNS